MLKQLSDGLSKPDTQVEAEANLETFADSFFGHTLTAEETDLIAEVLRGIRGSVAAKVRNR